MEINDIKIVYKVGQLNSTIKAANKLGYVQSNISKRIAKLEEELDTKLFHRSTKGMTLTTDGKLFLTYAEKILATVSKMEAAFSLPQKHLRIGATHAITANYLQHYYLDETVTLFTNSSAELMRQLRACQIDLMIVNTENTADDLKEIETKEETIFWAKTETAKPDVADNKIIVSRERNCPYRLETLSYLKRNKLEYLPLIEVDTKALLLSMLETNKAMAILPKKTIASTNKLTAIADNSLNTIVVRAYALKANKRIFNLPILD